VAGATAPQIAVDEQALLIVAVAVTNQPPDPEHLAPMLDRVIENCGRVPDVATADNGFLSQAGLEVCARRGVDVYVSLGRDLDEAAQAIGDDPIACKTAAARDGPQASQRRRKADLRATQGHRRAARWGNARREWSLVALTHNLLKLFRSRCAAPQQAG
jgi:hypothetical protein